VVPPLLKRYLEPHRLIRKKAKWEWGEAQQAAFNEIKRLLTNAPVLACPDWSKPFVLQTNASKEELGAALTQSYGDTERVIGYASRTLNAEKNYSATELECLAIKWGIWKFRDYLEGYHFIVDRPSFVEVVEFNRKSIRTFSTLDYGVEPARL